MAAIGIEASASGVLATGVDVRATASAPTGGLSKVFRFGGALTTDQANCLAAHWPELPGDWAANPYLRSVREHTRAYVERARAQSVCTGDELDCVHWLSDVWDIEKEPCLCLSCGEQVPCPTCEPTRAKSTKESSHA